MSETLKWGILGAARINQRLMPAIIAAKNSELVAIASRRPGAARETLEQYGAGASNVQTYDDPEQLLDNPDIQAVYLPMANDEHAKWALRAIEKGKHVLCEKPMALTVADIESIQSAAAEKQVKVMEGFMYHFHPQHQRVAEILDSGIIGEIRNVRSCFSFMMKPARLYRLEKDVAHGGGAMWDIGCYAIHTIRRHFDSLPKAATSLAKYTDSGADVSQSGVLDFGEGRFAQFDFSFERARRAEYEIIGTQGGLKCHNVWQLPGDTPIISWWTEAGQQTEERLPAANHFTLEIEHFSDCVLNDKQPALSLEDAKANCRTIVAINQSAENGKTIQV
ncbi:Gfo/Idh/MocA family protein [methane-oxidizing endosymbiont of Gigantopelta aegis]|uniref:Gfo/Idh/MocA family protein n=1 Tax=methane-oxidizing endosymbiont of Gigantopelta aegis TaxID=2794938 RepID=UPI0018DE332E|nr:Gfo/Idh/MocA family oxidoreductase [methane-oxidizing endosymbiont of Gigantopelta aegis]